MTPTDATTYRERAQWSQVMESLATCVQATRRGDVPTARAALSRHTLLLRDYMRG